MISRPIAMAAVAAVVALAVALPATAAARTDTRGKRVVFIHGYSGAENNNCEDTWRQMFNRFRWYGWTNTFYPVRYYARETLCQTTNGVSGHVGIPHHGSHSAHYGGDGHEGGLHNSDASIRHLGYHFAHYIYAHFTSQGITVDVAAHSMGGLIVRYALTKVREGASAFPPRLMIEDVVTMGTPHGGTNNAFFCLLDKQCQEMHPNSTFMGYLGHYGLNPQGYGGTDWTVIGAHDDDLVTAGSATDMKVYNAVQYFSGQGIEHSEYMHKPRDITDAHAYTWNRWEGRWIDNRAWVWPLRNADWALYGGLD